MLKSNVSQLCVCRCGDSVDIDYIGISLQPAAFWHSKSLILIRANLQHLVFSTCSARLLQHHQMGQVCVSSLLPTSNRKLLPKKRKVRLGASRRNRPLYDRYKHDLFLHFYSPSSQFDIVYCTTATKKLSFNLFSDNVIGPDSVGTEALFADLGHFSYRSIQVRTIK